MSSYRFVQLDVFTAEPFAGNPLAVFPEAEGLTDDQMMKIAREMNLSETVFVLRPDGSRGNEQTADSTKQKAGALRRQITDGRHRTSSTNPTRRFGRTTNHSISHTGDKRADGAATFAHFHPGARDSFCRSSRGWHVERVGARGRCAAARRWKWLDSYLS